MKNYNVQLSTSNSQSSKMDYNMQVILKKRGATWLSTFLSLVVLSVV